MQLTVGATCVHDKILNVLKDTRERKKIAFNNKKRRGKKKKKKKGEKHTPYGTPAGALLSSRC